MTGDADRDGDFLHVEDLLPGEWMPVRGNAIVSAIIRCPVCLQTITLVRPDGSEGHHIDREGAITPSIVCSISGCTLHVMGKLLDWNANSVVAR
jgi:hypothetical protein